MSARTTTCTRSNTSSSPASRSHRRALAIRAGALGDTIVALPAIEALARLADEVELVGTAPHIELVTAAAVHSIDRAMFRALFCEGGDPELVGFLGRFDLIVSWSSLPRLAPIARRLGIRLIEETPLPPVGVHASDHLFAALAPLGLAGPAPPPRIHVDVPEPGRSIAIHPSSGSPRKNWPTESFTAVARLAREAGLSVVWVQGEADSEVVKRCLRAVPGEVADELPLRELAAILAACDVYIGNDSGVSHLAAAVGAPTVAVFCTTDPAQWAPRGRRVAVAGAGSSPEAVWGIACKLMRER